jgi:hypothetical protein
MNDGPPLTAPHRRSLRQIGRASTTAGIALLVVAALGLGSSVVVERLVVEDDPAETAANIAGSEALFRLVIAGLLVVAAVDVVVACAFSGSHNGR